jgi:intracellular sulfur oxidation DsrE/DsrF family protein
MSSLLRSAAVGAASLLLLSAIATPAPTQAQQSPNVKQVQTNKQVQTKTTKPHRMVIQVIQNDAGVMNAALNNAENLIKYYEDKGETVEIEFVVHGNGLHMVRSDTSPVKDRIMAMSSKMKNVTFSGCGNTMANQSKAENKDITLLPQAKVVPAGIARILELQEQGWAYVRA